MSQKTAPADALGKLLTLAEVALLMRKSDGRVPSTKTVLRKLRGLEAQRREQCATAPRSSIPSAKRNSLFMNDSGKGSRVLVREAVLRAMNPEFQVSDGLAYDVERLEKKVADLTIELKQAKGLVRALMMAFQARP